MPTSSQVESSESSSLIFISELDQPSYEAASAKAKALSEQLAQAKEDVSSAQSALATMQSDYSALEEKIAGTKNKKETLCRSSWKVSERPLRLRPATWKSWKANTENWKPNSLLPQLQCQNLPERSSSLRMSLRHFGILRMESSQASAIADAVNSALSAIADVDVDITYHYKTEGSPPEDASAGVVAGRAAGTDYAAAGLTLVGEEGPELVMMHGGEKVLTAHETVNALSGGPGGGSGNFEISFQNTYNVSGGNAAEIRKALEEHDADLRDQVANIMQDIRSDEMRTRY